MLIAEDSARSPTGTDYSLGLFPLLQKEQSITFLNTRLPIACSIYPQRAHPIEPDQHLSQVFANAISLVSTSTRKFAYPLPNESCVA
jgi:hypothetical protein